MNGSSYHADEPSAPFLPDEDFSDEEIAAVQPRCTDSANADTFIAEHGEGFRYVVDWEMWIAWSGKKWELQGAKGRCLHAIALTARLEYYRQLQRIKDLEADRKRALLAADKDKSEALDQKLKYERYVLKHHEASQNSGRIKACCDVLQTRLTLTIGDLDKDPWLFNCANGTIDLRTADLREHHPRDFITQLSPVEWEDHSRAPIWEAFLDRVMGGSLDLTLYLQRLVGYSITALTREHILAFFYGSGKNGKSTFLRTIQNMCGDLACQAPRDLLFESHNGGQRHPAEIARLYGKRLAVCSEIGEHNSFDEAKVKDLTGGDVVACRRMNENWWEFHPTHTLFIGGNHKPVIRGDDAGIWRRIRLIPWLVTITDADIELPEKLAQELPGILRWAVLGCLEWQRVGLVEPEAVLAATRDYRTESDVLGEFFMEHCVFEPEARMARGDLRTAYETWCDELGHRPVGARKISQRLQELKVTPATVRVMSKFKNGWAGIRLRTEMEKMVNAEPDSSNHQN